jgi:hypothetical protein
MKNKIHALGRMPAKPKIGQITEDVACAAIDIQIVKRNDLNESLCITKNPRNLPPDKPSPTSN